MTSVGNNKHLMTGPEGNSQFCFSTISMGAFHSTKTSDLNFRQFPVAKGTAFPKIPKKEDNLARYTQIFEKIFPHFSFRSALLPEFLEFFVEWFAFRKLNSFRNFWKLFREISVPFAAVSKFSNVLCRMESAQCFPRRSLRTTYY